MSMRITSPIGSLQRIGGIAILSLMGAVQASAQEFQYGREVFVRNCAVCHTTLRPRIGDKKAWSKYLEWEEKALVDAVISPEGSMAPRAGRRSLSDGDIKAAVQYILSRAK